MKNALKTVYRKIMVTPTREEISRQIDKELDRYDFSKRPVKLKPLYRPKSKRNVAGVEGKSIFTG